MTIKPFEIQGAQLKLGGVQLEAGSTGVVIPGVTQATSYRVEEVEDTGDQDRTFQSAPIVIDYVTVQDLNNNGTTSNRATFVVELEDDGKIGGIEVDNQGSYTSQESSQNNGQNMLAYIGSDSDPLTNWNFQDWVTIPFAPKMRVGEVETIGGGNGGNTDRISSGDYSAIINGDNGVVEAQNGGFKAYNDNEGEYSISVNADNINFVWSSQDTFNIGKGPAGGSINAAAGKGMWITTDDGSKNWQFGSDGNVTFPDGSVQTTAYIPTTSAQTGYFNSIRGVTNNNGRWDGEAVLMDGTGNSYVSYSYYDDNIGNNVGGIAKFDSTGAKLWAKNYTESSGTYQYPRIASLEYFDLAPFIVALGYHYNNNTSLDEGFMFMIDTDGVMDNSYSVNFNVDTGMLVEDGVFYDDNGPAAVVAGQIYDENRTYTLTPIAPSTVNKLYVSWSDFNTSGLTMGQQPRYGGPNSNYYMNGSVLQYQVVSSINGLGTQEYPYMYVTVTYNEAGVYSITSISGGSGYDQFSNQTLKVLGSALGGTDGVNDLTFDFDWTTFTNAGQNYQNPAGITNVQGTAISDVFMLFYNDFDFSTVIGTTQTDMFYVYMGSQAAIIKLGQNGWSANVGSTNYERLHSVAVDPRNGDVYAVGRYNDNVTNKSGAVLKYDGSGNLQWAKLIDSDNYTGIELRSVEVVPYGEGTGIIVAGDDGSVTKLDGATGDILWQVAVDTNNVNLNNDLTGTATPEGDYIVLINEGNNYHLYVTKLSGADGSVIWQKDISFHQGYNWNGELNIFNDFDATNIDCDSTSVTIAGTSYYYDGNNGIRRGYVINIPSDGTANGTYGEWILTDLSVSWSTRSTTSLTIEPQTLPSTFNSRQLTMNSSDVNDTVTNTPIGGTQTPTSTGIERHSKNEGDSNITLASEHNGKFIYYNGSNGNSWIYVPSNNDVALPIGYTVSIVIANFNGNRVYVNNNTGSQNAVIDAVGYNPGNTNYWYLNNNGQCGVYTLMKVDTDNWMLAGPDIQVD